MTLIYYNPLQRGCHINVKQLIYPHLGKFE